MKYFLILTFLYFANNVYIRAYDIAFNTGQDSSFISLDVLNTNLMAFTNSITLDDLNKHFSDDSDGYLDDRDKEYLLSKFDGNSSISTYIEVSPIKFKINLGDYKLSISSTDIAYFDFHIPSDAPELILKGNEKNRTYSLADMSFRSSYYRKYKFGFKTLVSNLFYNGILPDKSELSINAGYIRGFSYVDANISSSNLYTDDIGKISGFLDIKATTAFSPDFGVNHEYANTEYASEPGFFNEPAGQGYSIDLIWNSDQNDSSWNYSLGIYDFGSIFWNNNTGKYVSNSDFYFSDIFNESQLDSLEEAFDFESKEKTFNTSLPTNVQFHISTSLSSLIDFPIQTEIFFRYYQALNESHYNSYTPKLSLLLNNHLVEYLPSIGFGIQNNIFNQFEVPLFMSYQSTYFTAVIGVRDISSYFDSKRDQISIYSNFTFFIY